MLNHKELYEKVVFLVANGETDDAIQLLKNSLNAEPDRDPQLYHDVILLAGEYNNWERQKLRGVIDNERDLNKISSGVLDIVERMRHEGFTIKEKKKVAPPPPPPVSPDPLRMAQTYQPPVHLRPEVTKKEGIGGQIGGWLKGFLIICGILLVVFTGIELMKGETYEDETPIGPGTEEPSIVQPAVPGSTPAVEPKKTSPVPEEIPDPKPEPNNAGSSPRAINATMKNFIIAGSELEEKDVRAIDYTLVQRELGNTVWYNQFTGSILFSADGLVASYSNGNGQVEVVGSTDYGFLLGSYSISLNGDYGALGIVPPQRGNTLYMYAESLVTGQYEFFEAVRQ